MGRNGSISRRILVRTSIPAGAALLALLIAVTTAWAVNSEIRLLPVCAGEPPRLQPTTYQTRPGFVPRTTFMVGRGWYGCGENFEWVVGKGLNRVEQHFGVGGVEATRLSLSYATAVSRFKALKTLTAGAAKPIRVGGYAGVSFHAAVKGEHALLPGIAPGIDVLPGGQQIFLNVRGTAVLVRIEIFVRPAGDEAVRAFLRTVSFPR